MPNIKSAEKRMRQSLASAELNKSKKSRITTERRNLDEAIQLGDKAKAEATLGQLASALDKGAKAGVINKNKADRGKARAAKRLAKLES
jgi:small subunit ribosomal protein S20